MAKLWSGKLHLLQGNCQAVLSANYQEHIEKHMPGFSHLPQPPLMEHQPGDATVTWSFSSPLCSNVTLASKQIFGLKV